MISVSGLSKFLIRDTKGKKKCVILKKKILIINEKTNIALQPFISCITRRVNTVPDEVLKKTRYSKLGSAIKSPSVDEPKVTKYKSPQFSQANRDYK
jgi:hypothetical protein